MDRSYSFDHLFAWMFTLLIFTLGLLNLFLVHPVPGFAYTILSMIFCPPVKSFIAKKTGFVIPLFLQIILGFVIIWFTLGISDLAEMYGL